MNSGSSGLEPVSRALGRATDHDANDGLVSARFESQFSLMGRGAAGDGRVLKSRSWPDRGHLNANSFSGLTADFEGAAERAQSATRGGEQTPFLVWRAGNAVVGLRSGFFPFAPLRGSGPHGAQQKVVSPRRVARSPPDVRLCFCA